MLLGAIVVELWLLLGVAERIFSAIVHARINRA
jgi:hypothetical protein